MIHLLDVNVLVALAWPNHVHHAPGLVWFNEIKDEGWATSPVTQSGFVRVSSNRRIVPEARTPGEAIALLRRIVALPGHRFWSDDVSMTDAEVVDAECLMGHRQVSDAHLVALAIRRDGRLATFDRGVPSVVPAGHDPATRVLVLS